MTPAPFLTCFAPPPPPSLCMMHVQAMAMQCTFDAALSLVLLQGAEDEVAAWVRQFAEDGLAIV